MQASQFFGWRVSSWVHTNDKVCFVRSARRLHYSYDEYLDALKRSDVKLEYCDGEIYAMAGGTLAHAALSARMIRIIGSQLSTGCEVFTSDAKVRIDETDLTTFPDASVVCGEIRKSPLDAHALSNPTLLVEVTSKSTEDYDRSAKLSHYRQIPSLQAILLVSHRSARVTVVRRGIADWEEYECRSGEIVELTQPQLRFSIDEVYQGIDLE